MATSILSGSAPSGIPTGSSAEKVMTSYDVTRVTYEYATSVTAAVVRWWIRTSAGWAVALDTSQDVELDPLSLPTIDGVKREIRDYQFGAPTVIFPEILSIAGGAMTIYIDGASLEV